MFWWFFIIIIAVFYVWRRLIRIEINPAAEIYHSSILRGSDPTALEKIVIDEEYFTWKKNRGWGYLWLSTSSVTMLRKKISGVIIIDKVIGSDIIVMGMGGGNIRANCFSPKDANEIKILLTL